MRTGNTAAYPPPRPAPRQGPPAGAPLALFHPLKSWRGYPAPRSAEGAAAGFTTERYYRFESTGAEVTLADTDATVKTFSGYPDKIVLHARTNGALVTLTDSTGAETDEVVVPPDETREVFLPRNVVMARNLVAGSNAALFAEAYYLAPLYAHDAR